MRGGDDADLDADCPLTSDADDFTVLHDAEQTNLRGERELADFVEEQRAAVGLLEPALAPRLRAGEGARPRGRTVPSRSTRRRSRRS